MLKKTTCHSSVYRRFIVGSAILFFSTHAFFANNSAETKASPEIADVKQENTVRGVVVDEEGESIIGASVMVKGEQAGTTTNFNGVFELQTAPNSTLVVSYVGYLTQEVRVDGQSTLRIILIEDTQSLEEIVVVGYGVQKKVNLTGSVSNIKMDEILESRPVSNISQGLAGLAAGVQVTSASNRPGENTATIMVRGQGTLNSGSGPLIIIDGVESNINSVNPQDIENMSILKDAASASIYGSRAANGVILITTRKGNEGRVKVDYNGYVSWESLSNTFDLESNYADYMELVNEGLYNSDQSVGRNSRFSQARIDEWRAGNDPLRYPNTDLVDALFRTAVGTNHNLAVSGGSERATFYTSFGFLETPGIVENTGFSRYSFRTNLEANAQGWLTVGTNLSGYLGLLEPGTNVSHTDEGTDQSSIFTFSAATTPGMVFRAPDGRYGAMNNTEDDAQSANNNPLYRLNYRKGANERRHIKSRFYGTVRPLEGLSVTGSFNYTFTNKIQDQQPVFIPLWNFLTETMTSDGVVQTSIMNSDYKWNNYLMDGVATYTNDFSLLNYSVMLGASQELFRYKWFRTTRQDLLDPDLSVINAATGASSSSGNTVEWAMHSYFGRINLNWADKYLFEFNLRADGSSRFTRDNRWGYFPSASAAWRIDQEPFVWEWTELLGLSNLKIRASYGELGNNALSRVDPNTEGNYTSQALYATQNYILNNAIAVGIAQTAISNGNLKWETTKLTDIGLDFGLLGDRLTGTLDYFYKLTEDILIDLPIPLVNGNATAPFQNAATVMNRGFEISLGWQDKIEDINYFASANFTFLKNKVTKYKGEGVMTLSGANMINEGYAYYTQYGHVVDRLIQTQEDLDYVQDFVSRAPIANPFVSTGAIPQLGDLMYKDLDGNGIIDDDDRTVIGHGPTPKFTFGINLGATYKGIDFAMLIQGAAGMEQYLLDNYFRPHVRYGYQINKTIADGRWYEGRTDAIYPRLLDYSNTRNSIVSDFWIQNKSYAKIKNILLGYTLPKELTSRYSIDKVRIYGSLENFFTFDNYDGLDPEVSGFSYPTSKQAVIGINVSF